jgi:hypothetical protein
MYEYKPKFSSPQHYLEMSDQLNAPAALAPWKEPLVAVGYEAGWAPEPVRKSWRVENLTLSGTRTPIPRLYACP